MQAGFNANELKQIRADFPILKQRVHDEALIYLDNAASNQKPQQVLKGMLDFYQNDYANIHRGVHSLAQKATAAYEASRKKLAQLIHAQSEDEIIFTSSTTAGLNLLAERLVKPQLEAGDIILTTQLEHHSNLVPWQEICRSQKAELRFLALDGNYLVDLAKLKQMNLSRVKAVVIHHVSNVLGVTQPLKEIGEWIHQKGGLLIVDGAQAPAHQQVDVAALGVDAYCLSGHKLYGPSGVGICYLKKALQDQCLPFFYGGEMVSQVQTTKASYKTGPLKFEGGTPPIAQAVGLGLAVDYLNQIGLNRIANHEQVLSLYLQAELKQIDGIEVYSPLGMSGSMVCFNMKGVHPHDAATAYDMEGIALRAGHHCAQPLMQLLGVPATLRASLALYNSPEELAQFITVTHKVKEFFKHGGLI